MNETTREYAEACLIEIERLESEIKRLESKIKQLRQRFKEGGAR